MSKYVNSEAVTAKLTPLRQRVEFDMSRRSMSSEPALVHGSSTYLSKRFDATAYADNSSLGASSILDGNIDVYEKEHTAIKEKADTLFPQFLEVLQGRTNASEIFDTIQAMVHICAGVVADIDSEIMRTTGKRIKRYLQYSDWLKAEMKTWKLLYALYKDRILVQASGGMEYEGSSLGNSEKEIIAQLYASNAVLREYQLIVDWLEACFDKRENDIQIGHSTNSTVGWENTLFQLKNERDVAFNTSGVEIVKSLDPDAPIREKRPLHALDAEDEARLAQCIFYAIRQGHIDEAMALCKYCGQSWRAALLEGWRLHEDPNYDVLANVQGKHEKLPIEGNPRRDVWKKCAWMLADSRKHDDYTRAIAGAFCGHLESLKAVVSNSWEDLLWAYLKVQIDIRVESELRGFCLKPYLAMPEAYWNSKMSLEQILDELTVHNDAAVRDYAKSKVGIIQKYLILDNIDEMLQQMLHWTKEPALNESVMKPHLLRFLTHIVLFLRHIARVDKEDTADAIIAAYVESLIGLGEAQLVAFYCSCLPNKLQVTLYAKYLQTLHETNARAAGLEEALKCGLDVENITRHTVRTIREDNSEVVDLELKAGQISAADERKIRGLEFLSFIHTQRGDLLWEANALIRSFLEAGKVDCVRAAYDMIPTDTLNQLVNIYGSNDNFPNREECSVREYLSYKVYLTGLECFNEWLHMYHNKPKPPVVVGAEANFTERIASEHKQTAYRADLNRWTMCLEEQTKMARDALFNVILFPESGWLVDMEPCQPSGNATVHEVNQRQQQLEKLRGICIPEVVLLLYKLLNMSGEYQSCIKLADEIVSETRQLYKVYTKHKLGQLLSKLAEASLELLYKKNDPWGYSNVN